MVNHLNKKKVLDFLDYAIKLTNALQAFHSKGSVYGGLRPNAFVAGTTGKIILAPYTPSLEVFSLEYLRYMSPEQAGRLPNIDIRSDLYSLGVVLYEALTGQLPFQTDNTLDLAHHHVAVLAPAPHSLSEDIFPILSGLVLKLLEKSPEARYASTLGLLDDLQNCQDQFVETGRIEMFELGHLDRGSQFLIPDCLYGREEEIAILDKTFDQAVNGEIVLCMVGGYSGIGKSALVRAMRTHILAVSGNLVEGKFDQYHLETPYSALIEAFKSLLRQVLGKPKNEIEHWRHAILGTLGENASIVIDVLPELEKLIGIQPQAPQLMGSAAQQRFNSIFSQLLKLFATREHPLVMFLDDLQWADFASLALIRTFVHEGEGAHLLMVGAYRDNEVDATHPMTHMLEDLAKDKAQIFELLLGPLQEGHVTDLISDTFYGIDDATGLAQLVMHKTKGNPFFTRQFLTSMVKHGELYYDIEADGWRCRFDQIRLQDAADNVVDLMMNRLIVFPAITQEVLKICACIGKRFDMALLANVASIPEEEALTVLTCSLQEELLMPVNELTGHREFQFIHDRVQQAAYSLEGGASLSELHLKIGLRLWEETPIEQLDNMVFTIVDQLNHALDLVDSPAMKMKISTLNLRAGIKAKSSMAYRASANYLQVGIGLLPTNAWQENYPTTYELNLHLAETYSVLNEETKFQQIIIQLLSHVQNAEDRLSVRIRQTAHLCLSSRMLEGLDIGCLGLKEVGIDIPKQQDHKALTTAFMNELNLFKENTAEVNLIDHLYTLPNATDLLSEKIMRLIGAMADAATITNTPLLSLLSVIGSNLSLRQGNNVLSPLLFTLLGQGIIAHSRSYLDGRDLAQVAMRLSDEKLLDLWSYGRSRVHQFWFILHWSSHIEKNLPQVEEALVVTKRAHDPLYEAYLLNIIVITHYFLGRNTSDVLAAHQRVVDHCRPYSMDVIVGFTQSYAGACAALRGETESLTCITSKHVDETTFREQFKDMPMVMGLFCGSTIPLFGLAGQWHKVLEIAGNANLLDSPPFIPHTVIVFWKGVACAALVRESNNKETSELIKGLKQSYSYLEYIFKQAVPDNVAHRLAFLDAEKARLDGDSKLTSKHYSRAVALAKKADYGIEEAYFSEMMAAWQAHISSPLEEVVETLNHARNGYRNSQAFRLQQRVEKKIADLNPSINNSTDLDAIDTSAILSAVQAISSQMELSALLDHLIKIIIEASGAESGAILLPMEDSIQIELSHKINGPDSLPLGLIRYVMNVSETVVLDHPAQITESTTASDFSDDEYFRSIQPASVLCCPIGYRSDAYRVLYLEHRTLSKVFSPKRLQVLDWLIAQAVISIENAELYSRLESLIAARTEQLSKVNKHLSQQQLELQNAVKSANLTARRKSEFLANMSHEIRTPMNAIMGMTRLTLETELNERQSDYLNKSLHAAMHLMSILDNILDFSKVEAGKLELERIPFNLENIFATLGGLTAEKARDKNLELIWNIGVNVPIHLIGDPLRLGQILINYCNNAIKFTEQGEIEITVILQESIENDVQLRFEVRDTGIGLSKKQLSSLFQNFNQADADTARKYGGTGLGLAICKQLANLMQGEVGVRSKLGKGSSFWFTTRLGVQADQSKQIYSIDLSELRILVVDDNQCAANVLRDILENLGCLTETVYSASAALDLLTSQAAMAHPFSIIMLDLMMPEMDGYEMILDIQRLALSPQPCLIALTVDNGEDIIQSMEELDISEVIVKPMSPSVVQDTLMNLLADNSDRPLIRQSRHSVQEHRFHLKSASQSVSHLRGIHILLVEDNDMNQQVAVEMLQKCDFVVDVADNGQIAINMVKTANNNGSPYDAVLMDMQMPIMDGITATIEIKQDLTNTNLPIIAMTANAMETDRVHCMAAGMIDFIAKPIDPFALFNTLSLRVPKKPDQFKMLLDNEQKTNAEEDLKWQPDCEIPGLDINLGLKRVMHNGQLYQNLLRSFVDRYSHVLEEIASALDLDDLKKVELIVHTLRSVTGIIGATPLQQAIVQLESAILKRIERSLIDEKILRCQALLHPLMDGLSAMLKRQATPQKKNEIETDPDKIAKICADLASLLAKNDLNAEKLFFDYAALFEDLFEDDFPDFQNALQEIEYDAALVILTKISENSGIPLQGNK